MTSPAVSSGGAALGCARANVLAEMPPPWQSKVVIINYILRYFDCPCWWDQWPVYALPRPEDWRCHWRCLLIDSFVAGYLVTYGVSLKYQLRRDIHFACTADILMTLYALLVAGWVMLCRLNLSCIYNALPGISLGFWTGNKSRSHVDQWCSTSFSKTLGGGADKCDDSFYVWWMHVKIYEYTETWLMRW